MEAIQIHQKTKCDPDRNSKEKLCVRSFQTPKIFIGTDLQIKNVPSSGNIWGKYNDKFVFTSGLDTTNTVPSTSSSLFFYASPSKN